MDLKVTKILPPTCPVCSSQATKLLCEVNGFSIWRCPESATDFVWPMPEDEAIQSIYEHENYFKSTEKGAYENYDAYTESVLPLFHELLDELEPDCVGKHVLDVGCAYGTHLALAAKRGWKCFGVEMSAHARCVAKERHGSDLFIVDRVENLTPVEFDLILLLDVIEHLKNPYDFFSKLYSIGAVGPRTNIVITTPNARSHEAVVKPQAWAYRHPPSHLVYYSAHALLVLMRRLQFDIVNISGLYPLAVNDSICYEDERFPLNNNLVQFAGLLCKAKRFRFSSMHQLREKLTSQIDSLQAENSKLRAELVEKDADLASKESELAFQEREVALLRQTKLFRLRDAILNKPLSLEKLLRITWLTGAIITPGPFKRLVQPLVTRLRCYRAQAELHPQTSVEAYQVKLLEPPKLTRPRVVHVIANFMTGGSSRLVVDLIEHLGHLYEQEVLTSYNPNPPSYIGVKIHECRNVRSPRDVIRYFQRFRPELLHVHYWGDSDERWYNQLFEAAERFGCRVIENVNTPIEPYLSDSVVQYVYVSEFVYRNFGKGTKGIVIHPGSNLTMFRREHSPSPPDDCIGMVYRLEPDKLDAQSIDVFIKVAKRRPQTRVLIVGGGTLLKTFKEKAHSQRLAESFTFTGYVSYQELPALYEQMSVFVAPVSRESFGQVSTFAMNMGIPVVGYDVGALSEIIENKRLLAAPRDSNRLAAIVVDLLEDREKRLSIGNINREHAQRRFSVEAMVHRYGELYEALLTGTRK